MERIHRQFVFGTDVWIGSFLPTWIFHVFEPLLVVVEQKSQIPSRSRDEIDQLARAREAEITD